MFRLQSLAIICVASLLAVGPAEAAGSQPTPRKKPDPAATANKPTKKKIPAVTKKNRARTPTSVRRERAEVPKRRNRRRSEPEKRWSLETTVTGVADSNISHESEPEPDIGSVFAAAVDYERRLRSGLEVFASYEAALHRYAKTDEWDRLSHILQGGSRMKVGRRLELETLGEIALKGSSEDRELGDRYGLLEQADFSLTDRDKLRAGAALRRKRHRDGDRNSVNAYGEIGYERELDENRKLTASYRYEVNEARVARHSYRRTTYELEYAFPVRKATVELELKYRPQVYDRLIEVDGDRVKRRDRRWIGGAVYSLELSRKVALEVDYQYTHRTSNDPDRQFQAHAIAATIGRRW